ncbi:MFS transporter [Rhodococcus sp. WMMA185]|uniref:MFS transporter n=1 Tax=Rhodococcus sp. WMMA185 TaxID=679318 RepID=UPI0008782ABD|nr:MFS transporter [Rhodococcus sp. WMMA185]AOW93635.1 MFS transporter [Rhodococcus sp. WMMA185]
MKTAVDKPHLPAGDELGPGTSPALAALLAGTFVGTMSNNILNVPLNAILTDFDADLGSGIFVVVGFLLTFAASMPLAGWVGDRFGRRRVYCAAMLGTAVCSVGAALAPSLLVLVIWRSLGGIAAAAIVPAVMGLITWLFGPARRARAVGAWAAVNGIGQAIGPSLGGVVSDWWGWRWAFAPLVPIALIGFVATLRHVPRYPGKKMHLDVLGAVAVTVGAALFVLGITLIPQDRVPAVASVALVLAGIVTLVLFGVHSRRTADPFIPIRLVLEPRFLRSALAVFVLMFVLSALLLALPLYLTDSGLSTTQAGLMLFVLPAVMTCVAPVVGRVVDRIGGRVVMRSGLSIMIGSQVALAITLSSGVRNSIAIAAILVVAAVGIGMVQTPAAAGSTRSRAGAVGTGLGLFNLIRFGGSAVGAAWVGIAAHLATEPYALLFSVAAVVALVGLAGSFVGENPLDV